MSDNKGSSITLKNTWTHHEDIQLKYLVEEWEKKYGNKHSWNEISMDLAGRTGEQCRKRWKYKLDPALKHDVAWTTEEDNLLIQLQAEIGNKWAMIGKILKGRSDVDVKNRFFSTQRKRKAEEDEEDIRRSLMIKTPNEYLPQETTYHQMYPYQTNEAPNMPSSQFVPEPNYTYTNMSCPPQPSYLLKSEADLNLYYNSINNFRPSGLSVERTAPVDHSVRVVDNGQHPFYHPHPQYYH